VRNLTLEAIRTLFPNGLERSFDRNQIVCYDADKPNSVFFVLEGHVKLYDIDDEGNEKVLHINGPRNIFPMLYAFKVETQVNGFYSCIDKTRLLIVPLEEFRQAAETNLEFSRMLNSWFLVEIQEMIYRLSAMEKTDARNKILYALKSMTTYYSHPKGTWLAINFPVTRQFMADYTGLARETVSIAMTELERDKIIRKGGLRTLEVKSSALPRI
jgi:CRP-like cAMP-binding protein